MSAPEGMDGLFYAEQDVTVSRVRPVLSGGDRLCFVAGDTEFAHGDQNAVADHCGFGNNVFRSVKRSQRLLKRFGSRIDRINERGQTGDQSVRLQALYWSCKRRLSG